jgi:hypothetical protein
MVNFIIISTDKNLYCARIESEWASESDAQNKPTNKQFLISSILHTHTNSQRHSPKGIRM